VADVTQEGGERVERALQLLGTRALPAVASLLYQEGERIMTDSKEHYVPVDTGVLRDSGYVEPPAMTGTVAEVVLGYGGPARAYALVVHENPRAGKTGGVSPRGKRYKHYARVGQWKYLSTPFQLAADGLLNRLAAGLEAMANASAR